MVTLTKVDTEIRGIFTKIFGRILTPREKVLLLMFSRVIDPAEYENGHENDLWYLEFCESLPLNTLLDESDCH